MDSFFEQFFYKYPNIIGHLLKDPEKEKRPNRLIITIENYIPIEIAFEYFKSILNINSPSYHQTYIRFKINSSQK